MYTAQMIDTHTRTFLRSDSTKKGIAVVVLSLCLYALVPILIGMATGTPAHQSWEWMGIQVMEPSFSDAYNITSAIESKHNGFDPLALNPADVTGRPMNYPRLWLQLGNIGIGQEQTALLATVFIVLFAAAILWMIRDSTFREGIVYAVVLCSPAVMLAVERGNNDLLIASLLILTAFFPLDTAKNVAGWGRYPLLLGAALLKLFPVAALAVLFNQQNKRRVLMVSGCLLLFALYVAYTFPDIQQIGKVVPAAISTSFGSMVLPDYVLKKLAKFGFLIPHSVERVLSLLSCIALPLIVLRRNSFGILNNSVNEEKVEGRLWLIASAVFCAVFILGNNYDYRLIFLLLAIPQLFSWIRNAGSVGASVLLTLVVLLLWLSFNISSNYVVLKDMLNVVSEMVAWGVYSLLCAHLLANFQPLQGIVRRIRLV